ncbi:RagB/SusD family nutrient uptake outer membrane protein [Sphingobacterium arenae]|uniref:RagB/SusD family nutrient uptake outer membrane protein n=1 Tax=Sphingobacterium arenae TaxID=1280598 RepID=A0ABR7XZX1_9SPHI|nr:RagB/SusD family nutrient uptake outer membrane protein [Sphingobacterium arenae]MBD1424607.1 RagB/SusD family nutrient uptake outer membrane protein [Sphingobacterium arenae]
MKKNIYTRIKTGVLVAISSAVLLSCNNDDFFILPDRGGIDAEIWSIEGAVDFHLNGTYQVVIPMFPWEWGREANERFDIHMVSDEHVFAFGGGWGAQAMGITGNPLTNHDVRYVGNRYQTGYGLNRYYDIARCNNAIRWIPEGDLDAETQARFLGQYHALRAMVYLELVKVYGGVTLVLEPQDPDNITAQGRASARACFEVIIDDLTKAMEYLEGITWTGNDWGRITYEAAAALKGKALLYWASPQFNPLDDPKHPYDASRWQDALIANRAAYEIGLANGHTLVPEYADIFRIQGSSNPETLISRPYSSDVQRRGHNGERKWRPSSEDGSPHLAYRATTKLLDAYPMKDGNQLGEDGDYTYDPILFWKDRDPRFEATFAYNGSTWALSGNANRRQWTYEGASNDGRSEGANWGVYCKRFASPTLARTAVGYNNDTGGGNPVDWIEMRFAEVMLNLADCANETGDMGTAKEMVRQIRQRAGIEQGSNDYGLGHIASIEEMRALLLNERMIEFPFENKRNADLRRTRNWHKLSGETLTTVMIVVEHDETASDAEKLRNEKIAELEAIDPETGRPFRDGIDMNDPVEYSQHFKARRIVQAANFRPIDIPAYHNFYTFHNDYVWRGVDIHPTIGWEGGIFDPLDD